MAHTSLAERALYSVGRVIAGSIYRVTASGNETLPTGGFLLLPNHITWVDAIILQLALRRPIRFIIDENYYRHRVLNPVLRLAGCIPISPRRAKEGIRLAAERIKAGEIVCLFPRVNFRGRGRCSVFGAATRSSREKLTRRSSPCGWINSGVPSFRIKEAASSRNGRVPFRSRWRSPLGSRLLLTTRTSRLSARNS
jgi:hypothetical protein